MDKIKRAGERLPTKCKFLFLFEQIFLIINSFPALYRTTRTKILHCNEAVSLPDGVTGPGC